VLQDFASGMVISTLAVMMAEGSNKTALKQD
jgi:hypothetical protein